MNWKKLTILLVLSFILLGCKTTIKEPPKIQWGEKGQQPDRVWTDYSWVIVAQD